MRLAEKLPQTCTRWFKVRPNQTQGCTRIQKQQAAGRPCFREFGVLIPGPQRPDLRGEETRPCGRGESMGTEYEKSGEIALIALFPQNGHPAFALDLAKKH